MTFRLFIEKIIYYGLESIGKYYSSYRGYVVDNEDPENMNRIMVQVPVIARGKTLNVWAWPKHTFSGSDYGVQVLPPKGDMVWVEFEMGNPSSPMWFHGHYARNEKPVEFATAEVYGFKTPKGQMVIIDDRDDIEKIIIKSNKHIIMEGDKVILEGDEIFLEGSIRGTPRFAVGGNGVFTTTDGKVIQVTNGLITGIS